MSEHIQSTIFYNPPAFRFLYSIWIPNKNTSTKFQNPIIIKLKIREVPQSKSSS
jgi:hypothetical protein